MNTQRNSVKWVALFAMSMLLGALASLADEPTFQHRYLMRGAVLMSMGEEIHLCLGTADGAEVGQELDVVRVTRVRGSSPKSGPRFERQHVGRVRIEEVFDDHFALAKVVSGRARKGDLVELEPPGS
jgi:hypothetical protein